VRNAAPVLKGRAIAGSHDYEQIPALVERGKRRMKDFYADFNARLAEVGFVAGDFFSIADITAIVTVDLATKALSLPIPNDHMALRRWYELISSRPGIAA
jgi:glutathione S-transferase